MCVCVCVCVCTPGPRYSAQGSPEDLLTQAEEDAFPHYLDTATRELAHSQLQTESLLQRIETLSGRIKSGLSLVEGTGTTVPTLPLISADDVMMTSSENSHTGERPCGEDRPHSETSGGGEDGERDGGEIEGEESYPVPEVDPKLVKALEKMRRLDERLADIVKVSIYMCVYLQGSLVPRRSSLPTNAQELG